MRKFTEETLALYNGKNGNPIYIAYKGKVYNVSKSFHWKEGIHHVLHHAGIDLTNALEKAPHGEGFLRKFPVVGVMLDTKIPNTRSVR